MVPDQKQPPESFPQTKPHSGGLLAFVFQLLQSLFRLFVSENRRREEQLARIRKIANIDDQEGNEHGTDR